MSHKLSLGLLRAGCALVLVVTTALFAASIPARFSQLNQLAPELNLQSGTLGSQEAAALETIGLSLPAYAGYITTVEALTAIAGIVVGAIIFWRRRNDRMALFVSIALATLGTFPTPLMTYFSTLNPFWAGMLSILQFIAIGPSPSRYVPRLPRRIRCFDANLASLAGLSPTTKAPYGRNRWHTR